MTRWDDDAEMVEPPAPAALEVEVSDPQVIAYLYGPDDEPIATLLNRRIVPFGFQP